MNVEKEARRDAREYARAQMFYGEGAGTRRKLITATVASKGQTKPGYDVAFRQELMRQDMADHAVKARHERQRKDAEYSISKNARGLATGNYQAVNTSVLVLAATAVFAHKTGYDVKAFVYGKKMYYKLRAKLRREPDVINISDAKFKRRY